MKKDELQYDLSNILNDTGAYAQIIAKIKEKYNIDLETYSPVFNHIEECLADIILEVENDN